MSCRKHILAVILTAASTLAPRAIAAQAAAAGDEQKLLGVLKSEAPIFEKAKACQRLAVIGTRDAVPVLAALLGDEKLAHYARFGLEPIPDPSVDAALREAAGKLKGGLLVGVLHSIGARRDAQAVGDLSRRLTDTDLAVAGAAATALGRIGNGESAKVLREALSAARQELKPAIGQAALVCAEALIAAKDQAQAVALYEAVRKADQPRHVQLAGARGQITAPGTGGNWKLLAELLQAAEEDSFNLALVVSRELKGPEPSKALAAVMPSLSPPRQALALGALGDRGDRAGLPAVLAAARNGSPEVKSAAARALGKLGDAAAVPILVEAATAADAGVAEAARATLATFPGKEADAAIVAALEKSDARSRSAIFDVVGRRRLRSAIPVLRKAAEEGDEAARIAAIQALGNTVGLDDIPILVERVLKPRSAAEKPVALEALRTACLRMPEPDACAAKVAAALAGAPAPVRIELLGVFTSIGGGKALEIVSASARDADESIREAAVRTIAAWESDDSGDALVGLLKGTTDARDRARLYGGLNSLLRTLKFPKEKKIALCNAAFAAARDDEERKLALDCYGGVPAVETLPLIFPHLENPALKEKTASVVTSICERLARLQKGAVIEPLKKVLAATGDKELTARAKKLLEEAGGKL